MVHVLPTWDDGDGVSLPGHDADIFLHGSWDEALEHSYVAPHGALIRHPHGVGLPENCTSTRKTQRQLIYGVKRQHHFHISEHPVTHDGLNVTRGSGFRNVFNNEHSQTCNDAIQNI